MKKAAIIVTLLSLILCSCTDDNYNLKNIQQTDMSIGKQVDIRFPIGSLEKIIMSDYIQPGDENNVFYISTNNNGDYSFNFHNVDFVIPTVIPSVGSFSANTTGFDNFSLPSIFKGENNHIILSDIVVELTVHNPAPVPFLFKVNIKCSKDGVVTRTIKAGTESDRIVIPANATTIISLSENGQLGKAGTEKHTAEGLELIFSPIVDKIEFTEVSLSEIAPFSGSTQSNIVDFDVAIYAPLAFKSGTSFSMDVNIGNPIDNISDSIDIDIDTIELDFAVENSLPLQLGIAATALDENGAELTEGLTINASCDIEPGAIANPATSIGTIKLSGDTRQISKVDSFKISLNAGVNGESFGGVPLNMDHFVRIKDISGHIIGGISL